jgi:hypothetical protein
VKSGFFEALNNGNGEQANSQNEFSSKTTIKEQKNDFDIKAAAFSDITSSQN